MITATRSLLVFLLSTFAFEARANCARGSGYDVHVDANTVRICPWEPSVCGTRGGMLRQNTVTGEVVKVADACLSSSDGDCYQDECVAPGSYRYGFATPYDCSQRGCGGSVPSWEPASVSSQLGACTRTVDGGAPTAYPAGAPWPNEHYRACVGCGCSGMGTTVVLFQVVLAAGALAWMARRRKRA